MHLRYRVGKYLLGIILKAKKYFVGDRIRLQEKRSLTDVSLKSTYENEYLKILSNKLWLLCTFALICESYLITAIISYGIKLLEVQFLLPTNQASIIGAISCLGGIFGMLGTFSSSDILYLYFLVKIWSIEKMESRKKHQ